MAGVGIDIVFAAGNCGAVCADIHCQGRTAQAIMGANAHPDVLTLGGCDTTDQIVGYSSQGPSIPNMSPQKPDVTAYTHFLGSEARLSPGMKWQMQRSLGQMRTRARVCRYAHLAERFVWQSFAAQR
jgi:hypothetical protein